MKPIETITTELVELLSDKTLSFGCKFTYPEEYNDIILTFTCSYWDTGNTTTVHFVYETDQSSEINDFQLSNCKIIGYPVTLARVLYMGQTLNEINCEIPSHVMGIVGRWDRSKDDLTLQSEETKRYLHSIFFSN